MQATFVATLGSGVCVCRTRFFGPWVQVEGQADIVELPDAMEPLVDYYRRISGEHDDWDDYRRAMRSEGGSWCGSPFPALAEQITTAETIASCSRTKRSPTTDAD